MRAARAACRPTRSLRILGQVARALDKAHAIGIVHRDLKPENLFLHHREDGTTVVKILDFGISRIGQRGGDQRAAGDDSRAGAVMGTPLYMAPSRPPGACTSSARRPTCGRVGLIAIFLLTGEHYWQGKTIPDVLGKVLNARDVPAVVALAVAARHRSTGGSARRAPGSTRSASPASPSWWRRSARR